MDKSYKYEKDCLRLFQGEEEIYKVPLSSLLWYSDCRPWQLSQITWKLQACERTADALKIVYSDGCVETELLVSMEDSYLKIHASFKNQSNQSLRHFTAGLNLPVTESAGASGEEPHKITIPHLIYNDNPSAEKDRIVPHIGDVPGQGLVAEEHRMPIPGVNIEWKKGETFRFLTMMSLPEVIRGEDEEYWALGTLRAEDGEQIVATSGPLMFNGLKDVAYIGQNVPLSWMKGYRILEQGACLEKTWYLDWGCLLEEGKGFRSLLHMGYDLLKPVTTPQHTMAQMIEYKKAVLESRYYKNDYCEGYQTFGAANAFGDISGRPEYFLYGWTGQSIKLAWCDCMYGLQTGDETLIQRGTRITDFWVQNGESDIPGLYFGYYVIEENSWRGSVQNKDSKLVSRIEGEAASDLADLMILLKQNGREVPSSWENCLKRICSFLMAETHQTSEGFYPFSWYKDGKNSSDESNSAGISCVVALAKAAAYFENPTYLQYACEKCEKYADKHVKTFRTPFAKATLDARCEDKEAGLYFFLAAAMLYDLTREQRFKKYADDAADWILSFVYHWETGFAADTVCYKNNFKTTGWPGVSVQNHHLDVYFPVYELYAYGKLTGNQRFMEMAAHVRDALTYGVCTKPGEWGYTVVGEQAEQYYHTNCFLRPYPRVLYYLNQLRGGMHCWNPSWITAQVMSSALKWHYLEDVK